jgi:3-phosphoshikimate 1-carboxyvinyltransferase
MYATPFLDLPPLVCARGTVRLPGSKSISNRVLLLAGLSEGVTEIEGLLVSDDTAVMLDALRMLGCAVESTTPSEGGVPATLRITGLAGRLAVGNADCFLGNSGTSMRSLAAAVAVLSARDGGRYTLRGVARMHERPIGDLVDALRGLGCAVGFGGEEGFPPLAIGDGAPRPLHLEAPVRVRGDVSSQFLTGLLQALCLVAAEHDVVIEVVGRLISRPYIAITLDLLARFGVTVRNDGWSRFTIPAGSRLRAPGRYAVEGDASSASYFIALGAIAASADTPVVIAGIGRGSVQGDLGFVAAAQAMGARVEVGDEHIRASRGRWPLDAITLDCNPMPDAAMTLAVLALYAQGTTRLTNIGSWRVKETDRIAAMAQGLRGCGATVETGDDWIAITAPTAWVPATIETFDDHRVAMCFSLAAFNPRAMAAARSEAARGVETPGVPVRILDPRCVAKTFPDYFESLFAVSRSTPSRIPVLAVDGPTASGKGTLASAVAKALGYHFLDSGAVYRATALAASRAGVAVDDEPGLARVAAGLQLVFGNDLVRLCGEDVTESLRREEIGALASKVSAWPAVRAALRALQIAFHRVPGLVADGRDMGTVIFPAADLKVFLTATAGTRAERRYKQLISKGIPANIDMLQAELEARDARDQSRSVSPLTPAADALLLDNSALTVEASVVAVLEAWEQRRPFEPHQR